MKKCIKNYCTSATSKKIKLLHQYAVQYNKCKNLFYNLYQNHPDIIFNPYKFYLRDKIVKQLKNIIVEEHFNLLKALPSKTQKCALQEAISDLKAIQTTKKNKIRYKIRKNLKLNSSEKEYLLYILKSDNLLNCIIKGKKQQLNDFYEVDKKKLNSYLHRLLKESVIKKPFASNHSFMLEGSTQITYLNVENKLYISVPTLIKREKVRLPLTDSTRILNGDLRVVLKDNRIELHKAVEVTPIYNINKINKVFISIGLDNFLTVQMDGYQRIIDSNLFSNLLKYQRKPIDKNQNTVKQCVDMDIKTFLKEIKPTAVIVKNLEKNFINNSDYNGLNKKTYKKIKRYIKDKLIYKCLINSVDLVYVSNAYTDKICSKCKSFDTIRTEYDLQCKKCTSSINVTTNTLSNMKMMYHLNIGINAPQSVAKRLVEQYHCPGTT